MPNRAMTLFGTDGRIGLMDWIKHAYGRVRKRLPAASEGPEDTLFAYRQLALHLSSGNPQASVLVATPSDSEAVAQSCALLSASLASLLKKPVLLVDLSVEGRLLPLIGISREMYCHAEQRSRFFSVASRWYASTREGIPIGPYCSMEEAKTGLRQFINAAQWIKDTKAEQYELQRLVLPSCFQNLFFLPSGPARQSLVRAAYTGTAAESISRLIENLHETFGFIVCYGGAVNNDALMLSAVPHVDEVLHAVIENDTRVAHVKAAQQTLQNYRNDQIPFILIRKSRVSRPELVSLAHAP